MARTASYTPDQLRDAVRTSRSWRAVIRALGLKTTSTSSVRAAADRLGLDYSHFTGVRSWSTEDLSRAVADSVTWNEVAAALGTSPRDAKTHALRAGLAVGHIGRQVAVEPAVRSFSHNPHAWRDAGELWAAAWFVSIGGRAALVAGQGPFDLLATVPGLENPQRVQVKTSGRRDANGRWAFQLRSKNYSSGRSGETRMPYSAEDVDLFFLLAASGEAWLVPHEKVLGNTHCSPGPEFASFKVNDGPAWMPPVAA